MPCTNTAGWLNPYDLKCDDYEKDYCEGGEFKPGSEWTGGKDYNFPERHCCACGKCSDQPGWDNRYGKSCADYEAEKHCADGAVVPGQEWTTGSAFNFPERACCVCGRDAKAAHTEAHPQVASPRKPAAAASSRTQVPEGGDCVDEPGWRNPYGVTCEEYVKERYCAEGRVLPGKEWTVGPEFSYPERACCACKSHSPPPPPPPNLNPPPPPMICDDECPFVFNGVCQDGGPGAMGASCAYGSDCGDCGPRAYKPPPPPPPPSPPPPCPPRPPVVRRSRPHPPMHPRPSPQPSPPPLPMPPSPSPSPRPPPPPRLPRLRHGGSNGEADDSVDVNTGGKSRESTRAGGAQMQLGGAQFVSFGKSSGGAQGGRLGSAPAPPSDMGNEIGDSGGTHARSPGEGVGDALLTAAMSTGKLLVRVSEIGARVLDDTAAATGLNPLYVQLGGIGASIVAGVLIMCLVGALLRRLYRCLCCCLVASQQRRRERKLRRGGYGRQPMRRAPSDADDSDSTSSSEFSEA